MAYVESYDDIAFWRTLLAEFENEERYFQVMLPSATSLAKGKKMVLMNTLNTTELGRSLIACVDSDYDFLLQGATNVSRKINRNPYISRLTDMPLRTSIVLPRVSMKYACRQR